jgi:hypothetical protein
MRFLKKLRWRIGFARVARSQIRTGRPPQTRTVFERLRTQGFSRWKAYRLLALAYEAEVAAMIVENRVYDDARYLRVLDALPAVPEHSLNNVP